MDVSTKSANQLLASRTRSAEQTETRRILFDGDLWLDGKGLAVEKSTDTVILAEMRAGFSSQNALQEVAERRADGVLGREPVWSIMRRDGKELTDAETAAIAEMAAAIVKIWNDRQMLDFIRRNYQNALAEARSEIHPFVPPAYRDANTGNVLIGKDKSLENALEGLHFEIADIEDAGVFLNNESRKPFSIFRYTPAGINQTGEKRVEFSFVDADGLTKFKIFRSEEEFDTFLAETFPNSLARYQTTPTGAQNPAEVLNENTLPLGKKLFLHEIDLGAAFITETMKSNQKAISLDLTMEGRNMYLAGYRMLHWLNTQRPKKEIDAPDTDNPGRTKKILVDDALKLGGGVATFGEGTLIRDDMGKVIGQATPSLTVIEPVDVKTFFDSKDARYVAILAEASQTHVLANDAAQLSGVSRRDSRSEHEKKLKRDKPHIDAAGRYIIEFMMSYAAFVSGRTAEFENYRVDFNCIVDAGLPTPEEKADNRAAYLAGEISLQTLQSRNGVEDTDSELSQIKSEDGYEFNLLAKAAKAFADAGGNVPFAVFVNQLPIEDAKKAEILNSIPAITAPAPSVVVPPVI